MKNERSLRKGNKKETCPEDLKLRKKIQMNIFWNKAMPVAVANYDWSEEILKLKTQKAWKSFLQVKIKQMDRAKFDLFLAAVVMEAAKKQVMGVDLTEKVEMFRELRNGK